MYDEIGPQLAIIAQKIREKVGTISGESQALHACSP
jgi:hypothetical protein